MKSRVDVHCWLRNVGYLHWFERRLGPCDRTNSSSLMSILFINIHLVYRRLCRRRIHRGVRPVQYPNIGTCFMDRLDRSLLHSDFK